MFCHAIACKIGKFVHEVEQMGVAEFNEWVGYINLLDENKRSELEKAISAEEDKKTSQSKLKLFFSRFKKRK